MERLPTLQYQLIGEFDTLLEYPSSSAISRSNLLQMMAINIFAITNTAAEGMILCVQCHIYSFSTVTPRLSPLSPSVAWLFPSSK